MRTKIPAIVLSLAMALLSLTLGGCDNASESISENSPAIMEQHSVSDNSSMSEAPESTSTESVSEESSEPDGEPTIFTGPDGKTILSTEIVKVEDSEKTAAELTIKDHFATVNIGGFTYIKEPTGVSYDTYNNPEMFDPDRYNTFIGEVPENTNEWKRVYVGDEICGMKVTEAGAKYMITDDSELPIYYVSSFCVFDGTITLEGFLTVDAPNNYDPDGGTLTFTVAENKLPLFPNNEYTDNGATGAVVTSFGGQMAFNSVQKNHSVESEFYNGYIMLGDLRDVSCDMSGLSYGDIAYVRVTISNLSYSNMGGSAVLDNIEVLSEVLEHDEGNLNAQPAPTR